MENIITVMGFFVMGFTMGMLFESINSFKKFTKEIADRADS